MAHEPPSVFQQLFYTHYPSVVRKLSTLVRDAATAEDLAQEVFLRLYRNPPDDLSRVGAWLQRTLTHIAYDHLRRTARVRSLTLKIEQEAGAPAEPDSETLFLQKQDRARVAAVLADLSDRDRQALLLRHSGYSYVEIADVLGVKPETVGTLLKRATDRFKRLYSTKEEQADDGEHGGNGCGLGLGAI